MTYTVSSGTLNSTLLYLPTYPLNRRGLNQLSQPAQFNTSTFNQLGQYTSSPGRMGYCYAELSVFFPSGGRNHRQYSLRLPTEGWPG